MSDVHDFIGTGLAWPLRVDGSGSLATTGPHDGMDGALRMIIGTAPGERLMRPDFGCRIWNLLFEPINANTLGLMAEAVREAVQRWEPRIDLEDVSTIPDPAGQGLVRIHLDYVVKATNDKRNLVYPFYIIPREVES